ncbi:hypothetical protein RRG08_027349 [Elysia crispata]|uniref:Uncharacterized protein n=1 Tax=Elysia crispata TaxID=231223 RepID=A0AAE0ZPH8_9GAST|nr:hypothetical protein RRG08_027349 [Elysia crispata]
MTSCSQGIDPTHFTYASLNTLDKPMVILDFDALNQNEVGRSVFQNDQHTIIDNQLVIDGDGQNLAHILINDASQRCSRKAMLRMLILHLNMRLKHVENKRRAGGCEIAYRGLRAITFNRNNANFLFVACGITCMNITGRIHSA